MPGSHRRLRLRGTVAVQLAPAEAIKLFTPLGERRWVHGWDPMFPAPTADETAPGTVFETDPHGSLTWVVVGRDRGRSIEYAVVAPRIRAGTVEVVCADDGIGMTLASVIYDMTALSEAGELWLTEFAAEYDTYLAHWGHAITEALGA